MQLAILLVLILIAVILAPWLLGVIAALIFAYGIWLVIAAALTLVFVLVVLVVYGLKRGLFPKRQLSSGIEQKIADVNSQHRAREAAKRVVDNHVAPALQAEPVRASEKRLTVCKKCEASIEKHSMYCPKCGKSPV